LDVIEWQLLKGFSNTGGGIVNAEAQPGLNTMKIEL